MTNKEIFVIGTVGIPACYGGFETLVENLIDTDKVNFTVYCSSRHYPDKLIQYKNANLVYIPLNANGKQSIFYDIASLVHSLFKRPDAVLILGVSGCIFLPFFSLFSSSRTITNIDGLEWRRDKWGKWAKWFLKFSEKLSVKYSDVIISDNQSIADYLLNVYSVTSEVIAYGGDHAIKQKLRNIDKGYALAICRIEPENNVEMILDAFSHAEKRIIFIGNWRNNNYGLGLIKKYARFNNIEIVDPIYDISRLFTFRSECSFYVHGHSAGGTNPSLVEMMHFSKPIYCYDCVYNRSTTEDKANFFSSAKQLAEMIKAPVGDNGIIMKLIAEKHYTWNIVRKKYLDIFSID